MTKEITESSFSSTDFGTPVKPERAPLATSRSLLWLSVLLLLFAIFSIDVSTPDSLALPVYYAAGLLLVIGLPDSREKICAAATSTLLMIVGYFLSPLLVVVPHWVYLFNHTLAIVMIWIVTILVLRHRHAQEVMRVNERVANERLAQLNTIYASAPVGLCFVDRDLRYVSINNALAELSGRMPDYFIGKTVREAVPELADAVEAHYRRVIETGQPVVDEEVQGTHPILRKEPSHWLCSYYPVHNDAGELLGVNVAVRDVTRRKQAEADTLFLLDLGECIRFAADADELLWAVAVALGEHLRANRCGFIEIDTDHERCRVQRDYHPHTPSLVGSYSLKVFSPELVVEGRSGQVTVIADVA